MRLDDHEYRLGIVIGYNRNPVIPGHGSAIFTHIWLKEGQTTAGCVALDETVLADIIKRIDPAKRPHILMGTREDVALLPGLSPLATVIPSPSPNDRERRIGEQ